MLYDTIISLRPYFFSLREIEDTVSLDMKFPTFWNYNYQDETIQVMSQDKNENYILVSFVSPSTKDGYINVISVVQGIIKFNKELEEKEKLFQEKIKELKDLFANESLDKLKNINFIENGGQESNTSNGVVG